MKRRDLIKRLEQMDGELLRQGAEHEVWTVNGTRVMVPRHREINEITAKKILKTASEGRE